MPDKAIDLIDEAGSRLRIRRMDTPPAAKKIDEDILRVRRDKESAMDKGALDQAKALDEQERDAGRKRDELDAAVMASGGDVLRPGGRGDHRRSARRLDRNTGLPLDRGRDLQVTAHGRRARTSA